MRAIVPGFRPGIYACWELGEERVEGVLTLRTFHTVVRGKTRTRRGQSARLDIIKATGAIRPRRGDEPSRERARWPPAPGKALPLEKKNDWGDMGLFNSLSISSALSSSAMVTEVAALRRTTDAHAAVHEIRGPSTGLPRLYKSARGEPNSRRRDRSIGGGGSCNSQSGKVSSLICF